MRQWVAAMAALTVVVGGTAQAASQGLNAAAVDPHAHFPLSTAATLERVEQGCERRGEPVRLRQDNVVVCEMVLSLPERIAARVLLQEPFAAPRALLRFTARPDGVGFTQVHVAGTVDDRRPGPRLRVRSLAGARLAQHGPAVLESLGGTTPSF